MVGLETRRPRALPRFPAGALVQRFSGSRQMAAPLRCQVLLSAETEVVPAVALAVHPLAWSATAAPMTLSEARQAVHST